MLDAAAWLGAGWLAAAAGRCWLLADFKNGRKSVQNRVCVMWKILVDLPFMGIFAPSSGSRLPYTKSVFFVGDVPSGKS